MERKAIIELVGAFFIAAIFLTSYAAFGNLSGSSNSATTTVAATVSTLYASARGTATVTSYSSVLNINVACANLTANVSNELGSQLSSLEQNGSINNFYSQQTGQILVESGNLTTYPVYLFLSKKIGVDSACTGFTTTAKIQLPSEMNFNVQGQQQGNVPIPIPISLQSSSIPITLVKNMSSTINISVSTLITYNGVIYGSIEVSQV